MIDGHYREPAEMPTESEVSRAMSADMRKRGISYVGPVITYSFMQSIGIVNDHLADCEYRNEVPGGNENGRTRTDDSI